jgi:ketosteroid isomerase-like protein
MTGAPQVTTPTAAVRSYYRRVDADDVDGLLALFAEDAVYRRPGYQPFHGRAALAEFYRGDRAIAHGTHAIRTIIEQGARVAVTGSFLGCLKDGSEVRCEFADFFRLDAEGRFSARKTFFYAPLV